MTKTFTGIVQRKIDDGKEIANRAGVLTGVNNPKTQIDDIPSIQSLLQPYFGKYGRNVSNQPNGFPTPLYLIFGATPRIDVLNRPEKEFVAEHGFDYDVFLRLIEDHRVIPSLYHRDIAEWRNAGRNQTREQNQKLKNILGQTISDGDAIEEWLNITQPELVEFRKEKIKDRRIRALFGLPVRARPDDQVEIFGERQLRAVVNRWAYLERYDKVASKHAEDLLKGGEKQKLIDFIHLQKWLSCSILTAGMGQTFAIGPNAFKLIDRSNLREQILSHSLERRHYDLFTDFDRDIVSYFYTQLTGQFVYESVSRIDMDRVLNFLKNKDLIEQKRYIKRQVNHVRSLIEDQKEPFSCLKEIIYLMEDYAKAVESDTKIIKIAKKSVKETGNGYKALSALFGDFVAAPILEAALKAASEGLDKLPLNSTKVSKFRADSRKMELYDTIEKLNEIRMLDQ